MESLAEAGSGLVAVLGVGHVLMADDAAGSAVAEALRPRFADRVFDGGQAPENFVGPLRRLNPDTILVVDAADFGGRPGEVRIACANEIAGEMTATHAPPLSVLMSLLSAETGADVRLVAIQPRSTELGAAMSTEVAEAVRRVAAELENLLGRGATDG